MASERPILRIILENPSDTNLAAIIRTCVGLGIEKIIIIDTIGRFAEIKNLSKKRKHHINSSSAGVFNEENIDKYIIVMSSVIETIEFLNRERYISYVTSPYNKHKENIKLNMIIIKHEKIAIWFGNESKGISDEAVANPECIACIQIPMIGPIESFNLGVSVALVLYEFIR